MVRPSHSSRGRLVLSLALNHDANLRRKVAWRPSALLALEVARKRIDRVLDFAEASDAVSGGAELEQVDAQAGCDIAHARVEVGKRQVVRAQMDELDRPPGRGLESARRLLGTDALSPLRDRGIKDAHG